MSAGDGRVSQASDHTQQSRHDSGYDHETIILLSCTRALVLRLSSTRGFDHWGRPFWEGAMPVLLDTSAAGDERLLHPEHLIYEA